MLAEFCTDHGVCKVRFIHRCRSEECAKNQLVCKERYCTQYVKFERWIVRIISVERELVWKKGIAEKDFMGVKI